MMKRFLLNALGHLLKVHFLTLFQVLGSNIFSLEAFGFSDAEISEIYLHCKVFICKSGRKCGRNCDQGRSRRASAEDFANFEEGDFDRTRMVHFGPISVKQQLTNYVGTILDIK